ncbi:MAG: radical SAM family heme chaperone HemW [Chloroflexi bacterium]|nr:radical SAM family heme chaperone HemW [Chloroflexota bacterium]
MADGITPASTIVPKSGIGLYIHIPFCKTKCPYCDFNTYQGIEGLMGPYLEALTSELGLWGRVLARPTVTTIFFGGGTPSYLPDGHIGRILAEAASAFDVGPDAEITIEANPGDLDTRACHQLLSAGVNRLSIGVQSLDNGLLELLGRRHDADQAVEAFHTARDAGFANVNLDLMYGLPRQTLTQWRDTVERLVSLSPAHISLYCLTLEEGTPLHHWVRQGKLPEPDPDLAADMYQHARESLAQAGYQHYEISNWSMPGFPARHNLVYWLNRPYLGVGPGAHSHIGDYRFWDVNSPGDYMLRVKKWEDSKPNPFGSFAGEELDTVAPLADREHIGLDTACAEIMFLGLRLLEGMDLDQASAQVGDDLQARYASQIGELTELGLLERQGSRLRLTEHAYLIANQVFTRFVE